MDSVLSKAGETSERIATKTPDYRMGQGTESMKAEGGIDCALGIGQCLDTPGIAE